MQEQVFINSEADSWFLRNKECLIAKTANSDLTFQKIKQLHSELNLNNILEIGCSNGYRLSWCDEQLGIKATGLEPSLKAITDGLSRYGSQNLALHQANLDTEFWSNTINELLEDNSLDAIVFGHCFYLVSPELYFQICAQVDRLLRDGGVILIFDFDSIPQRANYHHCENNVVWSYKMDFSKLFSRHPMYKTISKEYINYSHGISIGDPYNDCSLAVIRKISKENAFAELKPL